jgi:hypothetical protein
MATDAFLAGTVVTIVSFALLIASAIGLFSDGKKTGEVKPQGRRHSPGRIPLGKSQPV